MEFSKAVKKFNNYTLTENGAVALKSTEDSLVDLFATVGAMRGKNYDEVVQAFEPALSQDRLLATKLMFYARNVRGGLGERDTFRMMLHYLAKTRPEIVVKNLDLIPVFGRYDDLYALVGTSVEKDVWNFIKETIKADYDAMKEKKSISLCAKWLKSVNTSSTESQELGRMTAKALEMTEKQYRKLLSAMREYIRVTETKMSANEWGKIEYSQVPSRAMKNYRDAFVKHDEERFAEFIGKVEKGEAKINSSTLYPYDILMSAHLGYNGGYGGWGSTHSTFKIAYDKVLEEQWKALPNYVEGENNILVMSDTSGSMEGLPMATSIGLAIYFAERNKGAYKNLFLTFSESPSFVELKGDTLQSKVACVPAIVANTNLESAFDLILDVALKNHVSQKEMPVSLIVISDMHFDEATSRSNNLFFKDMKRKFKDAGYKMPTVIFWNVSQRASAFQAKADTDNVMLVSGQSTSTFKSILGNIGKTPYDFMLEVLNDEMYSKVRV